MAGKIQRKKKQLTARRRAHSRRRSPELPNTKSQDSSSARHRPPRPPAPLKAIFVFTLKIFGFISTVVLGALTVWLAYDAWADGHCTRLLAEWTSRKDFFEYCSEGGNEEESGCPDAIENGLAPPPACGKRYSSEQTAIRATTIASDTPRPAVLAAYENVWKSISDSVATAKQLPPTVVESSSWTTLTRKSAVTNYTHASPNATIWGVSYHGGLMLVDYGLYGLEEYSLVQFEADSTDLSTLTLSCAGSVTLAFLIYLPVSIIWVSIRFAIGHLKTLLRRPHRIKEKRKKKEE